MPDGGSGNVKIAKLGARASRGRGDDGAARGDGGKDRAERKRDREGGDLGDT